MKLAMGLAVALALFGTAAARAELLTNGDFNDTSGFVANEPGGGMLLTPGTGVLPGWIVAGGQVLSVGPDGLNDSSPARGLGLANGIVLRQRADLVLQLIDDLPDLLPYHARLTTFDAEENRDRVRDSLDELLFELEGAAVTTPVMRTPVDANGRSIWSFDFFTRGTSRVILRISGPSDDLGVYVGVDDVSVTPALDAAVPEPATWATMIAGIGAIGAALRRRRRSARVCLIAAARR